MDQAPASLGELFRSLDLTLTIRAVADEDDAWACTLARPDGRTYDIESVSFFDVDPDTGDEWAVEPSPSRVLGVLAGGDLQAEDAGAGAGANGSRPADAAIATEPQAADDAEAAARAFLDGDAYELLVRLDSDAAE